MVSNDITLNASSYSNLFGSGFGALYVPVSPSAVVYAQFDHIHGIAASSGQNGVSVNRISILNALIEQLVSMKTQGSDNKNILPDSSEALELSEAQQDMLIQSYQKQISDSIAQAQEQGLYGFAGLMPQSGTVFNIVA
jgi:hypothetical protein